ncbi:F-box domain-containing protein [Favolaschia claudopus]|uniref:F-box domain-containing protein n=1 Tax=Favolaschia claudopus TaxID=2862362 RepID=A0AAW0EG11_9AGAR
MLHLPAELVIAILRYIPLSTLTSLPSVSREWQSFCQVNESNLYHNAAILHGFVSSSVVYSELATTLSRRALAGVSGWKSFCYAQICIEKSWRGDEPSSVTLHHSAGDRVHRIKVDEERGFLIVTSRRGGISVIDLYSDNELWSLPNDYVHPYAHCEYGAGYLIFDRGGPHGEKEVWRHSADVEDDPSRPTFAAPDDSQLNAGSQAETTHGPPSRGHFRPWAVLRPPALTRAFRFVHPSLIAATRDSLFIWDIPTGELIQIIRDTQISPEGLGSEEDLGEINYVEISAQHAFVCGGNTLRAFSRATGRCVLDVPSSQVSYGKNAFFLCADGSHEGLGLSSAILKPQPVEHGLASLPTDRKRLIDEFVAVHVSACGSHLVAVLASSRLVIIPFFQRVIAGNVSMWDIALDIQVGSPMSVARYLAFENGRVALATGTGLFIISLDWESTLEESESPHISIRRAAWFNVPVSLSCITCLQMTRTGIYLNWAGGWDNEEEERRRHFEAEDLVPELGFETLFNLSLSDKQRVINMPNGDQVVQLFEPGESGRQTSSKLFSIDLTPLEY